MAQTSAAGDEELVPIDEVARRLGMQASALRYYERRGLLQPAARHGGRRWYGRAELRQLAIIGFWQQSGLMSLDDIAAVLAGPERSRSWKQIVSDQRKALDARIGKMTAARDYLEHLLTCPREHSLDGCPYFEEAIWQPPSRRLEEAKCHAEHRQKPSPGGPLSRPIPGAPCAGER
jgi:MerR family transcriptional regulator, copper efflux regulator